jgi:hypothetical protein
MINTQSEALEPSPSYSSGVTHGCNHSLWEGFHPPDRSSRSGLSRDVSGGQRPLVTPFRPAVTPPAGTGVTRAGTMIAVSPTGYTITPDIKRQTYEDPVSSVCLQVLLSSKNWCNRVPRHLTIARTGDRLRKVAVIAAWPLESGPAE